MRTFLHLVIETAKLKKDKKDRINTIYMITSKSL